MADGLTMPNTREKLIDIVEYYADYLDWDTKEDMVDSIMEFLATDNNAGHKWIPVTEMYPRLESYIYSVDVMFLLASGDVRIGYVNYESEKWKCRDSSRLFNKDDVTHWMPLPEPPKGE